MFGLSLRYMRMQKKRSILTAIGITLAVALVAGTGMLISSFQNMQIQSATASTGSWHYQITGIQTEAQAQTLAHNVLFQRAGITAEDTALFLEDKLRNTAVQAKPYLTLRETDAAARSMLPFTLTKGRMPKSSGEIALSTGALSLFASAPAMGDSVTLPVGTYAYAESANGSGQKFDKTFTQTGTRTFTVVGFYRVGSAQWQWSAAQEAVTTLPSGGGHTYSAYVQIKSGLPFYDSVVKAVLAAGISKDNIHENGLVDWLGQSSNTRIRTIFISVFLILAIVILLVASLVIRNAFAMSVSEKIGQIGTLRCLGASPRQVRHLVLSEALILWGISLPVGFGGGALAIGIVTYAIRSIDPNEFGHFALAVSAWPFGAAAALSLLTVLLSAAGPIRTGTRVSLVEAVRGGATYRDDRIRHNRRGRVLGKLFGFPALLAAKNIRRNPKRFRTTLLSVIVSVVLFFAVGGFTIGIGASIQNVVNGMSCDYQFFLDDIRQPQSTTALNTLESEAAKSPYVAAVQRTFESTFSMQIPIKRVPSGYLEAYKAFTGTSRVDKSQSDTLLAGVNILSINRQNYKTLKFTGKAPTYDELLAMPNGVLFCQTETLTSGRGRITTLRFADYQVGDTLQFNLSQHRMSTPLLSRDFIVKIAGVLAEKPWYAYNAEGYILVPQERAAQYDPYEWTSSSETADLSLRIRYVKGAEDKADAQMQNLAQTVARPAGLGYSSDYQSSKTSRNMFLIMQIFVYGFAGVIILICCINIFNTVHANLQGRKREIAMSRAVGMDKGQLLRMLLLECGLYGLIGSIWGGIIGYPIQLLLLKQFGYIISADAQSPAIFLLLSFLFSIGLGLLAGYSSIREMLRAPIVDEIRAQE
ncbi:ABC transporter permease [Ethanoligenens harbinense]|nr:ABC transporter permease [Ethanoligenens harbinense]AVQ96455.1 hypothetical protein CXQ68_09595 [Ethanoligenens harbinense YUAN-3]AYF39114.1 hypothetical protein CXP51_09465 [Ethanoligenens harbinense]AYF41940.1 hypothetical protein CN246_10035 [Ethanoligenens harbinense]QCN92696.1 hypothetical protein DRA42_09625 [Ethanoligenens harbinense]